MQSNGKLIVSGVIPGSPAEHVGILVGDIILRVNFNNPSSQSCEPRGWELSQGSKSARLLVRRNGFDREVTVPLTPVNALLSEHWISEPSYSILRPASLRSGQRLNDTPGHFLIGVRLAAAKNRLVVTAVLRGSPADKAGIRVGDTILTVDQKPAALLGARALDELTSNDHRYTTHFRVQRGTLIQDAVLRAVGVSEILRDLGTPVAVPAELSASAAY
jgi:C-terminal processing protease CtpA/Prc